MSDYQEISFYNIHQLVVKFGNMVCGEEGCSLKVFEHIVLHEDYIDAAQIQ